MWIAGWGATAFEAEAERLQEAQVPVLPFEECKPFFKEGVFEKKMCTFDTEVGAGPCDGDEGGPLQFKEGGPVNTRFWLYGLISYWGEPCGKKPAVYTRVSDYVDFIMDNIAPVSLTSNLV